LRSSFTSSDINSTDAKVDEFQNDLKLPKGLEVRLYINSKNKEPGNKKAIFRYDEVSNGFNCEVFTEKKGKNKIINFARSDIIDVKCGRGRANDSIVPLSVSDDLLFYIDVRNKGQLHMQAETTNACSNAVKSFEVILNDDIKH
jgi:hypothetical protein